MSTFLILVLFPNFGQKWTRNWVPRFPHFSNSSEHRHITMRWLPCCQIFYQVFFSHLEENILRRHHQSFYSAPSLGWGEKGWSVGKYFYIQWSHKNGSQISLSNPFYDVQLILASFIWLFGEWSSQLQESKSILWIICAWFLALSLFPTEPII